jgi:DNA-binding NtrC family response regulator
VRNVLVVGVDRSFYRRFEPILARREFDVDRVADVEAALALIESVAFDVIVLGYRETDPEVAKLTAAIRNEDGPCRRSAVLLLAPPESLETAVQLAYDTRSRVISMVAPQAEVERAVSQLLRVAPRLSVRITIRLEAFLGENSTTVLTQTENVSRGGMLVKIRRRQPKDVQLHYELLLPDGQGPVSGLGEVVRHTSDRRGQVTGVGIRFSSFEGDGASRLSGYLSRAQS